MDNRVFPNQQVLNSPNDQVFKTRYKHASEQRPKVQHTAKVEPMAKVENTVKRDTTQWILKNINANACLCNEESDATNMCHCGKNQEKNVSNVEKQHNKSDKERSNFLGEIAFLNNQAAKVVQHRMHLEPMATREMTKWIIRDITVKASLCNAGSEDKHMCHCDKNQEKRASNLEMQQNMNDTEPTNYFGEIRFDINHTAKYIQVHCNTTTPKNVLKLMKEKWNLEKPDLLISVYGSMTSFENTSLAKSCRTSLTKAVQGTGTWILTDGKNEYVNTHETTDEQPIIIGISQWRDIYNTHQMDTQQGTRPAEYYPVNNLLDPHHSHFILIDDGSRDTSSTTSKFREELESEIIKLESDNDVPFVLLVFQWDDSITKTVKDTLTKKLPVLSVKESDKKASGNEHKSEIPKDMYNSKITHTCEWNVDSCEPDLGLAIVQALSKACKQDGSDKMVKLDKMTDHKYLLKLAVAWNMFGIAKNISIDTGKQSKILESCMMAAILLDEVEYVKRILNNDFNLNTFLTKQRLKKLYKAFHPKDLIKKVLEEKTKLTDNDKKNVLRCVQRLLEKLLDELKPQLNKLDNYAIEKENHMNGTEPDGQHDANTQSVDKDTWLDLFVWSVLNNRTDMAKLFWRRGKDAMAAALFAHALLSAMSRQIDDKDFKEKCKKDRCDFTNLAIGILKEGYIEGDVNLAKKLLIQNQARWANTSCILIAVNAKNKQFISDHACQDVLHNIWMGKIDQETVSLRNNLTLLLCIIFPLLILRWVTFRTEDTKPSNCVQADKGQNSNQENQPKSDTHTERSKQGPEPTAWKKIQYFYEAPVVICFHNVIAYMIFLALYSYSLMTKVNRYLAWQEILLCVWVFTIFTHEVTQLCSTPSKGVMSKLCNYLKDGWNIIDIDTVFLFLIGMLLRIADNPDVADSALVVHGVNLITFYLRLLHIFSVHRELGPKLVMIVHMVKNMAYFFMILVVFIVAYGIASHAILYPHTEPSFATFTEIFRRPYWNIYGELMLDTIEGSPDCTNDPTLYNSGSYSRCPTEAGKYFVPLLIGVYMLMCNILLLNLLIAMFSFTFQKVQDNSYLYWSFQQCSLINEYVSRPVLVPPVIIFHHVYQIIVFIVRKCCTVKPCEVNDATHVFCVKDIHCSDEENEIEKRYKNGMEDNSSNVCEADSANLGKRMEQMEKQLNRLVQMQSEILEKLKSNKD